MGQSRFKDDGLRAEMLANVDVFVRPASDLERLLSKHIPSLTKRTATRVDRRSLDEMLMKPAQCHFNCKVYADMEPSVRWLSGWWEQGDVWMLHSVVEHAGGLACLTPVTHPGAPATFTFVPDPDVKVDFVPVSDRLRRCDLSWKGFSLADDLTIRSNPDVIIAAGRILKEALLGGVEPREAERMFNHAVVAGYA